MEGLQMDTDKNYNAVKKRIKNVHRPEHIADAVNLIWVQDELNSLKSALENSIMMTRVKLESSIRTLENSIKTLEEKDKLHYSLGK